MPMTFAARILPLAMLIAATPALADQSCNRGVPRSPQTQEPASLQVINVGGAPLILDWIDFSGRHKTYATIPPGGRYRQQTYVGHVWMLVTQVGNCVKLFRARPGESSVRAALTNEDIEGGD